MIVILSSVRSFFHNSLQYLWQRRGVATDGVDAGTALVGDEEIHLALVGLAHDTSDEFLLFYGRNHLGCVGGCETQQFAEFAG